MLSVTLNCGNNETVISSFVGRNYLGEEIGKEYSGLLGIIF
jgi:hypothetical protein